MAREKMSCASMLMRMNLYNVGNCLPHRMQYPIGALTGTSHAAGLAVLYPGWIREEYKACPDKAKGIFQAMVRRIPQNCTEAEEMMRNFLAGLGILKSLAELGIEETQISTLVEKISGDLSVDPIGKETGICEKLYRESLVGL